MATEDIFPVRLVYNEALANIQSKDGLLVRIKDVLTKYFCTKYVSKALSLLVLVFIAAGLVCTGSATAQTGDERPITFHDSNLEQIIRKAAGKPAGSLYPADLESITRLDVRVMIEDLTGLEHCVNLTELNLRVRGTNDLSPLNSLIKLKTLALDVSQRSRDIYTDLSPLASLTNLSTLDLHVDYIRDILPLALLNNLTTLDLSFNQIGDISLLASLTNLTTLDLSSNQIRDISALSSLTDLTTLDLRHNRISDISALSSLTNLTTLNLSYNQINDISPLLKNTGLSETTRLSLNHNPLSFMSRNIYTFRLLMRGVKTGVDGPGILNPGLLLILVCVVIVAVLLPVCFSRTDGVRRRRLRRDGLIAGIAGAGLSTFFVLLIVGYNCVEEWWEPASPELPAYILAAILLLLGSVAVAWRWEHIGGALLIVEGIFSPPLLLSGILFLLSAKEGRIPFTLTGLERWFRWLGLMYFLCLASFSIYIFSQLIIPYIPTGEMAGPEWLIMGVAFLFIILIPFVVVAWWRFQRVCGALIAVIGWLPTVLVIGGGETCLPVHMFLMITLPIVTTGTLFLLAWREGTEVKPGARPASYGMT